jgi:hypothetical protein
MQPVSFTDNISREGVNPKRNRAPAETPQPAARVSSAASSRPAARERVLPPGAGASQGWLLVKSNPPFAQLRVDDAEVGRTPILSPLRLPAGKHRLDLRRDGCLPLHAEVMVGSGETTGVRLMLERDTLFHP